MRSKIRSAVIVACLLPALNWIDAQVSYPMTKLGTWVTERDLAYYYSKHASPLVLVGEIVYLPHPKCVDLRQYGGSYTLKDIDGNTVTKTEGAALDGKAMEGGDSDKSTEAGIDLKQAEGDKESRSSGAEAESKDHSGAIERRKLEEEQLLRSSAADSEDKSIEAGSNDKTMDGGQEMRMASAGGESKTYGGVTLYIRCRPAEGALDLVNYMGKGLVGIYDINGMRKVEAIAITYE